MRTAGGHEPSGHRFDVAGRDRLRARERAGSYVGEHVGAEHVPVPLFGGGGETFAGEHVGEPPGGERFDGGAGVGDVEPLVECFAGLVELGLDHAAGAAGECAADQAPVVTPADHEGGLPAAAGLVAVDGAGGVGTLRLGHPFTPGQGVARSATRSATHYRPGWAPIASLDRTGYRDLHRHRHPLPTIDTVLWTGGQGVASSSLASPTTVTRALALVTRRCSPPRRAWGSQEGRQRCPMGSPSRRGRTAEGPDHRPGGIGALALALAAYTLAIELSGNGFIGAFVGGLAFGTVVHGADRDPTLEFDAQSGEFLSLLVLSVVAHGFTARPLSRRYGRYIAALAENTPERAPVPTLGARPQTLRPDGAPAPVPELGE